MDSALCSPVGNKHPSNPLIDQVARRQLGGISGPQDHGRALLETFKNLFGEFHRRIAHRHCVIANARLRADRLRHAQGALKELRQNTAGAAGSLGRHICSFDLPENLWFPEHQGVQTRGYAKQMAHGLEIAQLIKMGRKLRRRDSMARRHKGYATGHAGVGIVRLHIHFDAITSREDDQLLHLWRAKMRQGLRQGRVRKCQALPDRYWGRRMVQPNHNNRHARSLHRPRGTHKVCTKYDARTTINPPTVARAALIPCQPNVRRPPSNRAYMNHARRSGSEVRFHCRYDPYVYLAHTEPVTMPCVKKGKPSSSALAFSSSSSVSDGK